MTTTQPQHDPEYTHPTPWTDAALAEYRRALADMADWVEGYNAGPKEATAYLPSEVAGTLAARVVLGMPPDHTTTRALAALDADDLSVPAAIEAQRMMRVDMLALEVMQVVIGWQDAGGTGFSHQDRVRDCQAALAVADPPRDPKVVEEMTSAEDATVNYAIAEAFLINSVEGGWLAVGQEVHDEALDDLLDEEA